MASNPNTLPKAPASPVATPTTTPLSNGDLARAIDLFINMMITIENGQQQMHPADQVELLALANRIRNAKPLNY